MMTNAAMPPNRSNALPITKAGIRKKIAPSTVLFAKELIIAVIEKAVTRKIEPQLKLGVRLRI